MEYLGNLKESAIALKHLLPANVYIRQAGEVLGLYANGCDYNLEAFWTEYDKLTKVKR